MSIPFNAAADRNKEAIGDALAVFFVDPSLKKDLRVLEIGSGTGQHANYLSQRFNQLVWQPTEQPSHFRTLGEALSQGSMDNVCQPVELEVSAVAKNPALLAALPLPSYPFVYSANTAHIMSMKEVASLFTLVGSLLTESGVFALYGPFMIDGKHTSEGNRQFDQSLRAEVPHRGIRDKAEMQTLGEQVGLQLTQDISMPANNRILIWHRS